MSIPTARTPSSTGPAASAATTRKEGSGKTIPLARLKSARRRADACGHVDDASPRPQADKENRTRRSGHMMRYQNRTTSFGTDGECQRFMQKSCVSILYGQSREEDSMDRPEGRIRGCLGSFGIIWPAAGGARATGSFRTTYSPNRQ